MKQSVRHSQLKTLASVLHYTFREAQYTNITKDVQYITTLKNITVQEEMLWWAEADDLKHILFVACTSYPTVMMYYVIFFVCNVGAAIKTFIVECPIHLFHNCCFCILFVRWYGTIVNNNMMSRLAPITIWCPGLPLPSIPYFNPSLQSLTSIPPFNPPLHWGLWVTRQFKVMSSQQTTRINKFIEFQRSDACHSTTC